MDNNEGIIPNGCAETMWMFISLLVHPIDVQVSRLSFDSEDDQYISIKKNNEKNHVSYLVETLIEYSIYWEDEFGAGDFTYVFTQYLTSHRFATTEAAFRESVSWQLLRFLAKKVLEECGLDTWPPPNKINFEEFIEFYS